PRRDGPNRPSLRCLPRGSTAHDPAIGPAAMPPTPGGHMAGTRVLRSVAAVVLTAALMTLAPSVAASSGPAVRGGGVVGGALGTTSQLGFNATSSGGSFLCVMAGRSGGFEFGPWTSVQQMHVQGRVTPGSLSITAGVATFSGSATIHVIGRTSSG